MSLTFGRLLTECLDSLGESAGPLLDALVSLSQDEDEKIRLETEYLMLNINVCVIFRQFLVVMVVDGWQLLCLISFLGVCGIASSRPAKAPRGGLSIKYFPSGR